MKTLLIMKVFSYFEVYFKNILALKNGALMFLTLPIAVSTEVLFKEIFKNVELKEIAMPVIITAFAIIGYFIFFIIDFWTGLIASKYEKKKDTTDDWVKSDKLYNSLGKVAGVLLINFILGVVIFFLIALEKDTLDDVFLTLLVFMNILAMLYEYHSIGENFKRRTGKKPKMFEFFDRATTAIEEQLIERLKKVFE